MKLLTVCAGLGLGAGVAANRPAHTSTPAFLAAALILLLLAFLAGRSRRDVSATAVAVASAEATATAVAEGGKVQVVVVNGGEAREFIGTLASPATAIEQSHYEVLDGQAELPLSLLGSRPERPGDPAREPEAAAGMAEPDALTCVSMQPVRANPA